jgi:hypothetical protein
MIYLSNSGTSSIESFESNNNQRIKSRRFFCFQNDAYISKLKYDITRKKKSLPVGRPHDIKPTSLNQWVTEVLRVYIAGTVCFLAASGLYAIFG